MLIDKIKAVLTKMGFNLEGKSDDDLKKMGEELGIKDDVAPPATPPVTPPAPQHNADIINQLKATIDAQSATINEMKSFIGEMKTRSDNSEKALKEEADRKRTLDIKAMLDDAVKTGRIPADSKEKLEAWQKRAEKDFDLTKEALAEIPENKSLSGKAPEGGKSQTFVSGQQVKAQTSLGAAANNGILQSVMENLNTN